MLHGKFWITPEGVHEVTLSEHWLFAKNWLLKLDEHERFKLQDTFKLLTPDQVERFRARGIPEDDLRALSTPDEDLRVYMIRRYCWVRTRRSDLYLWQLDDTTLERIRRASDFWSLQGQMSADAHADLYELSPQARTRIAIPVVALRDVRLSAKDFKALAVKHE
ncbi:MAG: hypothetical protein HS116_19300 [Planctomycetes bacterium]|nr:hypothetical protein [Planctomycetota bacterium]